MSGALIVIQALVLGALILAAEWSRPISRRAVDFLRAASSVYFMCFVVLPLYLQLDDFRDQGDLQWAWLLKWPFDGAAFAYAGALAFIGYCALLTGFHLAGGDRRGRQALPSSPGNPSRGAVPVRSCWSRCSSVSAG